MSLRLGDKAPNFTADTTDGELDLYQWKGDSWAVLFSHPADCTPVCTAELGRTAALEGDRVIASPGMTTGEARDRFENLEEVKPYLRWVDDPRS
jgi:hypothetical protein